MLRNLPELPTKTIPTWISKLHWKACKSDATISIHGAFLATALPVRRPYPHGENTPHMYSKPTSKSHQIATFETPKKANSLISRIPKFTPKNIVLIAVRQVVCPSHWFYGSLAKFMSSSFWAKAASSAACLWRHSWPLPSFYRSGETAVMHAQRGTVPNTCKYDIKL